MYTLIFTTFSKALNSLLVCSKRALGLVWCRKKCVCVAVAGRGLEGSGSEGAGRGVLHSERDHIRGLFRTTGTPV